MSKRQKFILTSLILSLGLFFVQDIEEGYRYWAILGLSVICSGMTFWSLREALAGIRWITTIILPTFFTGAVGLFYFLLPQSLFSRLPVAALYALGIYALLLTENIFSVAAIRTIQLFRAAQAVGFLLTLFTAFLMFDTVFSFKLFFWENYFWVFFCTLPLGLQGLWSVTLEENLHRKTLGYTFFLALAVSQIALVLSFWPLTITMASLALTTVFYVLLGIAQADLQERLFRQTIYEYLGFGLLVLLTLVLTTRWGA